MRSLQIRFFVAFWLIIGISIGIAALGGYWYAERIRDAYESFEIGDVLHEASAALESAGRDGLVTWLENYREADGVRILVLDSNGRDLLGRPVSPQLLGFLNRQFRSHPPSSRKDPDNLRRARPLTQLVGPDGARYTFVLVPPQWGLPGERGAPPIGTLFFLTLLVSAGVSLLLARTLSRPVSLLRDATLSLATGNLDSRVSPMVGNRNDELGMLAKDFDQMAANLQRSASRQAELARNVSHELRSPLARLRVALELARRRAGNLPEFDRIDLESERLDSLIGQILSYSRIETVADGDKHLCNLNELLSDIIDDVNFECRSDGSRGVSVTCTSESRVSLRLHAGSIRSALENILRNAARHTSPKSTVRVYLRADADKAIIFVDDEGPGVRQDELQQLFEPFFRTRDSQSNSEGTGLGLAIAMRAIKTHGGTLSAENRSSGGLRMTITLPFS